MKLQLTFELADFDNLRTFEKAVKRQVGNNVYVGTDSMCLYFDYPKELRDRLRPSVAKFIKMEMKEKETFTVELESSLPDAK